MKSRICICWIGLSLMLPAPLSAQAIGNPIIYEKSGQLTVSATGGFGRFDVDNETFMSDRYLFKASYGPIEELHLFGRFGIARLHVGDWFFAGTKPALAYGGGVHLRFLNARKAHVMAFATGQVFRFISQEDSEASVTIGGEQWTRFRETEHDWLEYGGALGMIYDGKWVDFYGGCELLMLDLVRSRRETLEGKSGPVFSSERSGDHLRETSYRPFVGIDLALPSRLKLTLEVRGTDFTDGAVFIGLSQRGSP